jgi:hypothetical protein
MSNLVLHNQKSYEEAHTNPDMGAGGVLLDCSPSPKVYT